MPEFSHRKHVSYTSYVFQCQTPRLHWGTAHAHFRKSRICSCRGPEPKGARQACRSLVNRVGLLALLANHSYYDGTLISCYRNITYMLLCGCMLFRTDDMKEVLRQTAEERVNFHDK